MSAFEFLPHFCQYDLAKNGFRRHRSVQLLPIGVLSLIQLTESSLPPSWQISAQNIQRDAVDARQSSSCS